MTSSKHMTFSLDNQICNGLVQWTSVCHGFNAGKLH